MTQQTSAQLADELAQRLQALLTHDQTQMAWAINLTRAQILAIIERLRSPAPIPEQQAPPNTIKPGDFVKALRNGQRMWFQVLAVEGDKLTTMLDSKPVTHFDFGAGLRPLPIQPTLKRNDVVTINASDVLDHEPNRQATLQQDKP